MFHEGLERIEIKSDGTSEVIDYEILTEFFESTNGKKWNKKRNWASDRPFRIWCGVDADKADMHAMRIDLSSNNLSGNMLLLHAL